MRSGKKEIDSLLDRFTYQFSSQILLSASYRESATSPECFDLLFVSVKQGIGEVYELAHHRSLPNHLELQITFGDPDKIENRVDK